MRLGGTEQLEAPRYLGIEGLLFLGLKCKQTQQNPVIVEGIKCQFYSNEFETKDEILEFFKDRYFITSEYDCFVKRGNKYYVKHVIVTKENYDKII